MKSSSWLALVACLMLAPSCTKKHVASTRSAPPAQDTEADLALPGSAWPAEPAPDALRATDELTWPTRVPRVGDRTTEVDVSTMTIAARRGLNDEVVTTQHSETVVEVVAVDGGLVTSHKITYRAKYEVTAAGDRRRETVSPLAGKSYLVWREGGALAAARADGTVPPTRELMAVLADNAEVGRDSAMERILADQRWKLGTTVALTAAQLAELNGQLGHLATRTEVTAMACTLQQADPQVATFGVRVGMNMKIPEGTMAVVMRGTQRVDRATGRTLTGEMRGPFRVDMAVPSTGTMAIRTDYTY